MRLVGLGALILIATAFFLLTASREVMLLVDGQARVVNTRALTTGWALHDAGLAIGELDEVSPGLEANLPWQGARVEIRRPRVVSVWRDGVGLVKTWLSTERLPARLLETAGVTLGEGEGLLWNGAPVELAQSLPLAQTYLLQVRLPYAAAITSGGQTQQVSARGPAIGQALWAAGLRVTMGDFLSAPFNAWLAHNASIVVKPAVAFKVQVDGRELNGRSAAATVGRALAEVGVALQGLDYAVPAEDQPLPANGRVRVVRVREEIELKQTPIPYKNEYVADPNTELDQTSLVQAGQTGLTVARLRVRYEDGKEVARSQEAEWTAAQPKNQKTGYGTKVVIRTLETPDGPIQYYRKVTVYATSFAPCNFIQFIGRCSYTTAAGYPLQKGVIGVGEAWYRLMKGWGVYVDGYGPAKVGDYGYVPGFWVDLGYSDADFINWHRNTTLYFLTPVPATVPWILPK